MCNYYITEHALLSNTAPCQKLYKAFLTGTCVHKFLLPPLTEGLLPALPPAGVDPGAGIAGWVPVISLLTRAQVPSNNVDAERVSSTNIRREAALVFVKAEW